MQRNSALGTGIERHDGTILERKKGEGFRPPPSTLADSLSYSTQRARLRRAGS